MQDTKNIVVYVHGKGGCAREAEHYKPLFPGSEVLGFDYRAQTPWEAREEFPPFFAALRERCETLTLVANSIGAFFSLSALDETLVDNAWLISPVVDMEKLIGNMMQWASVTEGELAQRLEIPTQFGETLSWRYLCDVREHPISWRVPTRILYRHSLCGAVRRVPHRHARRGALVPHRAAAALPGPLAHGAVQSVILNSN